MFTSAYASQVGPSRNFSMPLRLLSLTVGLLLSCASLASAEILAASVGEAEAMAERLEAACRETSETYVWRFAVPCGMISRTLWYLGG